MKAKASDCAGWVIAGLMMSSGASAATLTTVTGSAIVLLIDAIRIINLLTLMIGMWWVMSGVLKWKKSAGDPNSSIEFKQIITPIISGLVLSSFSGFVAMTSETFGLQGFSF